MLTLMIHTAVIDHKYQSSILLSILPRKCEVGDTGSRAGSTSVKVASTYYSRKESVGKSKARPGPRPARLPGPALVRPYIGCALCGLHDLLYCSLIGPITRLLMLLYTPIHSSSSVVISNNLTLNECANVDVAYQHGPQPPLALALTAAVHWLPVMDMPHRRWSICRYISVRNSLSRERDYRTARTVSQARSPSRQLPPAP
jgi:hypothetical protein